MGKIKLNLGSRDDYKKGWINLDKSKEFKADIYSDIQKKIPLKDNSVDFVLAKHILEHINPEKLEFVMDEIRRVVRPKGLVHIYVPHFSCGITYRNPSHLIPMSYYTFTRFSGFEVKKRKFLFFRESNSYKRYKSLNLFRKIFNPILSLPMNLFPLVYERFFCWIFPAEELEVVLEVKK